MKTSIIITIIFAATLTAPAIGKRNIGVPEAKPLGSSVNCISLSQIRESRVRSDKIIDFRTSGNKWYRNTLPFACPSLGFEERFGYATSLNQLCSVDIITVLYASPVSRGASCGLGTFQPVELSKTR
jgi:hypothetical protein